MYKIIVAAVLIGGLGVAALPVPADAAQTRAKVKRAVDGQPVARNAPSATRIAGSRISSASQSSLRDRSTYYQANGRLDGKAFFETLQERSSGAGE